MGVTDGVVNQKGGIESYINANQLVSSADSDIEVLCNCPNYFLFDTDPPLFVGMNLISREFYIISLQII